ncbi:MAG: hypothetical protein ABI678_09905 [Kofleriaceae bacterium]
MSIFTQARVVTSWPSRRPTGAARPAPPAAPEEVTVIGPPPVASTLGSVVSAPAPRTCAAVVHTSTTIAAARDARLLAILDQDLGNEPAYVAFNKKEKQLGDAFAALPVFDQRALQVRLSSVRPGDLLAEKFNRLAPERRTRLLNFLGDARRRAARSAARSK